MLWLKVLARPGPRQHTGLNSIYGTALTTILPISFLYLNTVIVTAGTFEP
jgi:hypothetical protein